MALKSQIKIKKKESDWIKSERNKSILADSLGKWLPMRLKEKRIEKIWIETIERKIIKVCYCGDLIERLE